MTAKTKFSGRNTHQIIKCEYSSKAPGVCIVDLSFNCISQSKRGVTMAIFHTFDAINVDF